MRMLAKAMTSADIKFLEELKRDEKFVIYMETPVILTYCKQGNNGIAMPYFIYSESVGSQRTAVNS